jgi:hypothetical protein
MRKTQLIIFDRPNNSKVVEGTTLTTGVLKNMGLTASPLEPSFSYQQVDVPNSVPSQTSPYVYRASSVGRELDLFDDVAIPITYTILDIREPEKRKTSWSKTITIPGTKNNNRIFSHIYQMSADAWIRIGNVSVYQGFNPNIRTEVVILNDGVQVMKGNLQLKKASKDLGGNITYEIAVNGDLTSLFYDVGDSKLSDLDWTDYDHVWSRQNIVDSWNGIVQKGGQTYSAVTKTLKGKVRSILKEPSTGRLMFKTATNHGLQEGDFAKIELDETVALKFRSASGEWRVMSATGSYFSVNYFYPIALSPQGENYASDIGSVYKTEHSGEGYVYPLISWGDEYDYNTFNVTNLVPGFYVKQIWDKIMKETNSNYQSDFLDSQFFKRLFIVQKKSSYDINPQEIASRKFCVGLTGSYQTAASARRSGSWYYLNTYTPNTTATASTLPVVSANRIPFKKETGWSGTASFYDNGATQSGQIGNWDENTYSWVVSDTGEYRLNVNLKFSGYCKMNGYSNNFSSLGTASFSPTASGYEYRPGAFKNKLSTPWSQDGIGIRIKAQLKLKRNGLVSQIGETISDHFYMNKSSYWQPTNTNWLNFGTYQPANWKDYELNIPSGNYYYAKNDQVWVEVSYYVQAGVNGELVNNTGFWSTDSFHELDKTDPDGYDRQDIRGDWYIKLESQSFILNDPTAKSTENSLIEGSAFLPKDLTCKDFLLGVITNRKEILY